MDFISAEFVLFLAVAALVYRFSPVRFRPAVMLCSSYAFYVTWSVPMAAVMLGLTVFAYLTAQRINASRGRPAQFKLLVFVLGVLTAYICYFKVTDLLPGSRGWLVALGVSYYTFKLISYVVDVYWDKRKPEESFVPFAAFVAFFPQIVAGPIERSEHFLPQAEIAKAPGPGVVALGCSRILLGFFKKAVVADQLAVFVNYGFAHLHSGGSAPSILAFYLFPLQLFADFSGLTDIANGAALLFGFVGPENFEAPFAAGTISEFWRRWHMTLSFWVRDYVFMPLRMATRNFGRAGVALSIAVNMILIGLWHGFKLGFLIFGLLQGAFLIVDALTMQNRKRTYKAHPHLRAVAAFLGPIVTFHLFAVSDIFFRAPNASVGWTVLIGLFSGIQNAGAALNEALAPPNHHAWIALPAYALMEIADYFRRNPPSFSLAQAPRWQRWSAYSSVAGLCIFTLMLLVTRKGAPNGFLYAIF